MSDTPALPPVAPFSSDLLNRQAFAKKFESFLLTEHHFVEGALVVTLNASFGSGKTTFVRMWTDDLHERRKTDPKLPRPVIISAWETDFCGDPLVAIVAALKDVLVDTKAPDPNPTASNKLRDALKDIGWFVVAAANEAVTNAPYGFDVIKAGEFATDKKEQRSADAAKRNGKDLLQAYEHRRAALERIKRALSDAFQGPEASVVVVIDDLDRCRPDYAVSYLETIKHIFDVHGIAFVLCVDEEQLSSATSVLFGPALNFDEYYRKFSHRTVRLPAPDEEEYRLLTETYVKQYIAKEGKRLSALALNGPVAELNEIFGAAKIRPRQAQEVFRILGHAGAKRPEYAASSNWMLDSLLVFMAVLRVGHYRSWYLTLSNPDASPGQVAEVVAAFFATKKLRQHWFSVLVCAIRVDAGWADLTLHQFRQLGLIPADEPLEVRRYLADYLRFRPSEANWLTRIATRIDHIAAFAER
jgi:hypothetical protein